jgi:hypothetical protein
VVAATEREDPPTSQPFVDNGRLRRAAAAGDVDAADAAYGAAARHFGPDWLGGMGRRSPFIPSLRGGAIDWGGEGVAAGWEGGRTPVRRTGVVFPT